MPNPPGEIDAEQLLGLYRTITRIRGFEERVAKEFKTGEMPSFVHMYIGEEAIAAGVIANLAETDYITSTHRGHGHAVAKGCSLRHMMAELYGKEGGLCHGRGGSMHIADFDRGMLGANAIVGGGIALATGGAFAAQVRGDGRVAVAFFGDGAVNQGVLYESLNLASIWKLPSIYVCENNGWAETTPFSYSTSVSNVADRAAGFGIPGVVVDSGNVLDVYGAAREAVQRARAGDGPTFIEVKTYRFHGHFEGDPEGYRTRDDRRAIREHDPIPRLRDELVASGVVTEGDLEVMAKELQEELDEAVAYAKASPFPDPEELTRDVYVSYPTTRGR